MKRLLLLLLLIIPFISFSQKVTYKNIIGTWEASDTSEKNQHQEWRFTDSLQFFWLMLPGDAKKMSYSLDTLSNPTLLQLEFMSSKFKQVMHMYFFLKMTDTDTLRAQSGTGGFGGIKPAKWDDNETFRNTGIFVRKKVE